MCFSGSGPQTTASAIASSVALSAVSSKYFGSASSESNEKYGCRPPLAGDLPCLFLCPGPTYRQLRILGLLPAAGGIECLDNMLELQSAATSDPRYAHSDFHRTRRQ